MTFCPLLGIWLCWLLAQPLGTMQPVVGLPGLCNCRHTAAGGASCTLLPGWDAREASTAAEEDSRSSGPTAMPLQDPQHPPTFNSIFSAQSRQDSWVQLATGVLAMASLHLPLATPKSPCQPRCHPCQPSCQSYCKPPQQPPTPSPTDMLHPEAEHPSALQSPCAISSPASLHSTHGPDGAAGTTPGHGSPQACRTKTFARLQTSQIMLLWCPSMTCEHELWMPWKVMGPGCLSQLHRDGQRDTGGFDGSQHCAPSPAGSPHWQLSRQHGHRAATAKHAQLCLAPVWAAELN